MRVGIIGAGLMAGVHLEALAMVPGCDVVGLCDRDVNRARDLAQRYGVGATCSHLDDLLEMELDLVDIITTPESHIEITSRALEAGRNVLCEKPLALTSTDIDSLMPLPPDVVTAVMHQRRYDPVIRTVTDLVAQGAIGQLEIVNVDVITNWGPGVIKRGGHEWVRTKAAGGGALLQVMCHYIDLAHFMVGDFSVESAHLHTLGDGDSSVDDVVAFSGVMDGGGVLNMRGTWRSTSPTGFRWEIHGTDGAIRIEPDSTATIWRPNAAHKLVAVCADYVPRFSLAPYPAPGERTLFWENDNLPLVAAVFSDIDRAIRTGSGADVPFARFGDAHRTARTIDHIRALSEGISTQVTPLLDRRPEPIRGSQ